MKINLKSLLATSLFISITFSFVAVAQDQEPRFYLRGDLGGTINENTALKEFFGPVTPGSTVKFDPGFRMGVAFGYEVTDWFAGEFETGVMANQINSITDGSVDNATLSNVPLLVNARFQLPNRSRFTPYIGAGVGGAAASINSDSITVGGTRMTGGESTMVFAYQAFGGVRYKINERMGICLAYHYFATTDPEWKVNSTSGVSSDRMKLGGIQTHAITAAFEWRF